MSCTESSLIKQFKVDLTSTIGTLRKRISEGVVFTKAGVDNRRLLSKYTNIYNKLELGTEEAIRRVEVLAELENDVMFTTIRSHLKETFKGSIGTGDTINTKANVSMVLESTTVEGDKVVVKTRTGSKFLTFTFRRGTNVSELSSGGKRLYIPMFEVASSKGFKAANEILAEVDKVARMEVGQEAIKKAREYLYGDAKDMGNSISNVEAMDGVERADYIHGDIDNMKSMLLELQTLGNNKASNEHVIYLESLFDSMSPSFFREMTLYINENTSTTKGLVDLDSNSIMLNLGKKKSASKSEAEVYAHEVIHTMTAWALNDTTNHKVSPIKRELDYVLKKGMENTTWQDLLGKPESEASKGEIKEAKAIREYMFNSENSDHELLAHVLTNPKVMEHFKTIKLKRTEGEADTLLDKAMELFYKLMDIVLGNYTFKERNNDAYKQVHALAFRLAQVNSGAEATIERLHPLARFNQWLDDKELATSEKLKAYAEKHIDTYGGITPLRDDATKVEKFAYYSKFLGKSLNNVHYRRALGFGLTALKIKPEGILRNVARGLFTPQHHERLVEWISMKNGNIDTLRFTTIAQAKNAVRNGFANELTEEEDVALTRGMLDTNLSQLLTENNKSMTKKVYSKKDIQSILGKGVHAKLKDATRRLEDIVNNLDQQSEVNWIKKQASGLGYYMATHKAGLVQQLNAGNIAIGYGSYVRREFDHNLVEAINEVAVLTAVKHTKQEYREALLELVDKDFEGVQNLGNMYEAFKRESKAKVFATDAAHMIDGYTKELFDDTTDVKFVPMVKQKEMEGLGYKLVSKVDPKAGETRKEELGMFVSDLYGKAERLRGAVNLGGYSARGVDIKSIKYAEDIPNSQQAFKTTMNKINANAEKALVKMYTDEPLDFKREEFGLVPVHNSTGKVVNYRYITVDKEEKAKRMKQDLRATEVMSRSMGSLVDKELRVIHNEKVLGVIKELMSPDYWGGGDLGGKKNAGEEYVRIGPNAMDEGLKELYYMLPKEFKTYANSRAEKVIAVPAHLVNSLFGYQQMQMGNIIPGRAMSKEWRQTIQRILNMVEAYWVDLIKIAKGNILLKMPAVLVSNIVSNVLLLLNTGVSPVQAWKLHKESFRDVKAFMKNHKDITRLGIDLKIMKAKLGTPQSKEARDKISKEIRGIEEKINRIDKEMKSSHVNELVETGMFQSVIEDVETAQLNDNNLISSGIGKVVNKAPKAVRIGLQWAYLSQETKWYQFNQEVLQLSDLIARDVMNRGLKIKEKEIANGTRKMPIELQEELGGVQEGRVLKGEVRERFMELSREHRLNTLLDSFINYNKPNSRLEEWGNRVGLLMFTKWLHRIQRIILNIGTTHPIRTLGMLATAGLVLDVESIQDATYLGRSFGFNGDFSPTNIIPVYSPLEQIQNVATPAVVKFF